MPAAKLDLKVAERMLRAGRTQQDVVDEHKRRGIDVTQKAVSLAVVEGRINVPSKYAVTGRGIPWKLRPEHRHLNAARMLRSQARKEQGLPIGESLQRQLDRWVAGLLIEDMVVYYNPDTPEGFWRVPRRPGIDEWYVREPWIDDDGNAIPRPA